MCVRVLNYATNHVHPRSVTIKHQCNKQIKYVYIYIHTKCNINYMGQDWTFKVGNAKPDLNQDQIRLSCHKSPTIQLTSFGRAHKRSGEPREVSMITRKDSTQEDTNRMHLWRNPTYLKYCWFQIKAVYCILQIVIEYTYIYIYTYNCIMYIYIYVKPCSYL